MADTTQQATAPGLDGLSILQSARHYLCVQGKWNRDTIDAWEILNKAANDFIWGWLHEAEGR